MSNSNFSAGRYWFDLSNNFLVSVGHLLLVSKEQLAHEKVGLLTKSDLARFDSFLKYITDLRERGFKRFYPELFVESQNVSEDEKAEC